MRPKLLKSFIVVCSFWFCLTTLMWMLADPSENLKSLKALNNLFPFLNLEVPPTLSIVEAWHVQLKVLGYWTIPLILGTLLIAFLGLGVIVSWAMHQSKERSERETGNGCFRDVTLTKGVLPEPMVWPKDSLELGGTPGLLTDEEAAYLADVLGTISSHADEVKSNKGVEGDLMAHVMGLVEEVLQSKEHPGLAAMVIASRQLGFIRKHKGALPPAKITRFRESSASNILTALSSWWDLPEDVRNTVMLCTRYYNRPGDIPDLAGNTTVYDISRKVLDTTYAVEPRDVTPLDEHKEAEKAMTLSDMVFKAFLDSLPLFAFSSRKLARGVPAVAYKVSERRVYLIEIKLRNTIMQQMPEALRTSLIPNPEDKSKIKPFTQELLKALDENGWLVKEIDGTLLPTEEALWNVQSGTIAFKGVIAVDVPDDHLSSMTDRNSLYPVEVTGPLFTSSAKRVGPKSSGVAMDIKDMPLRTSSNKPAKEIELPSDMTPEEIKEAKKVSATGVPIDLRSIPLARSTRKSRPEPEPKAKKETEEVKTKTVAPISEIKEKEKKEAKKGKPGADGAPSPDKRKPENNSQSAKSARVASKLSGFNLSDKF